MKVLRWIRQAAPRLGLAGVGFIGGGILFAGMAFSGRTGEKYSLLNHFVSELGEYAHSELAIVFNAGLFLGGICLLGFMLGLAFKIEGFWGWVFGGIGLITSISGGLVGIFSMDNLGPHFSAAMTFFYSGLGITILFSLYILIFDRKQKFARWLALPGGFSAAAFFVFLFLTDPIMPEDAPVDSIYAAMLNRPAVWETAVFEWVVVISILVWVACLSIFLLYKQNESQNQGEA